jgi:hypothetical protein
MFAMHVTNDVDWDIADFIIFGTMLVSVGGTYELVVRMTHNAAYRAAVSAALAAAFILVWMNLAVGVIGAEGNPANLMYGGVLAVVIIGSVIARLSHDSASSGVGRYDRPNRRIWLRLHTDRNLRRIVAQFGLALSESGTGANFRERSALDSKERSRNTQLSKSAIFLSHLNALCCTIRRSD